MKYLLFCLLSIFIFAQDNVEMLYNAAVEKYIKNDYDKAVEYMEKVYSLSPQQKYKNFIIKILYEGANYNYMRQNYTKAYEYTSKALKYTTENENINQLHKILADILQKTPSAKKQISQTEKEIKQEIKEQKISQPTKKTKTQLEQTTKLSYEEPVKPKVQPVIIEDRRYKIMFFIVLSLFSFTTVSFIIYQIKVQIKIRTELQNKLTALQKENETLKTQLLEAKKEIETSKEKDKMYQQQIKHYETELKEKDKIISSLQNELANISKLSLTQTKIPTTTKQSIKPQLSFDKQQKQILSFLSTISNPEIYSEYELELYREKFASMLKTLFEMNPQKTYSILQQMLQNENAYNRANVVSALVEIGTEETFLMLFNLYEKDKDERVKREIIKQLMKLKQKILQNKVSLPEDIKQKILFLLEEEKRKGEWLF